MNNKKKNGFTLVELIVVMTIIMIVSVVGIVSYSGSVRKARDGRRISDVQMIRQALEMYRQGTGSSYPGALSNLTPNYIQQIPSGPKGEAYVYTPESAYVYRICAFVEDLGSTTADVSNCAGLPAGYAGYFKAKSP